MKKTTKKEIIKKISQKEGTPVFVLNHDNIKKNYHEFRKYLPRVEPFFAVKANSNPEIIKTMYAMGASFDIASFQEFQLVYENIKHLSTKKQQEFIQNKIIYANTIKPIDILKKLSDYNILTTFDNIEELKKIKQTAPNMRLILRIRVPNNGSMVELSSKFGIDQKDAIDLIEKAVKMGMTVEGLSFHVGSQCTNFENYTRALKIALSIFKKAKNKGYELHILDIGGGFPVKYKPEVKPFKILAKKLRSEINYLFPNGTRVIAEPGRFMVANAATLVTKIIGKAVRDGKTCYYLDDGVYHTFSGQIFDHCHYPLKSFKNGKKKICSTFGPTCDALDTISLTDNLPELEIDDLLYAENIGAYTIVSSTYFNGFPPPKVIHLNL